MPVIDGKYVPPNADDVFRWQKTAADKKGGKRAAYNNFTPRRADKNQSALVKVFRDLGAKVTHTHTIGHGVWDVVIAVEWLTCWVEIKDGDKTPSGRKLTYDEWKWGREWPGLKAVAINPEDVHSIVAELRNVTKQVKLGASQIGNRQTMYDVSLPFPQSTRNKGRWADGLPHFDERVT